MKRLLASTTVLAIVIDLMSSAVIGLSRASPLPQTLQMAHFEVCELPCWIGIVPGLTTVEDAKNKIRMFFGEKYAITQVTDDDKFKISYVESSNEMYVLLLSRPQDYSPGVTPLVRRIAITFLRNEPYYGQIFAMIGNPDGIRYEEGSRELVFRQHMVVYDSSTAKMCLALGIGEMVHSLEIYEQDVYHYESLKSWRGFNVCH